MASAESENSSKEPFVRNEPGTTSPRSAEGNRNARRLHSTSFLSQWWLELLCISLMFLSITAIILTLAIHQGQPLPQWPLSISINALLSIYGTIFKGAMLLVVGEGLGQLKWLWFRKENPLRDVELFDSATRGPKGALELLWAFRRRFRRSIFPVVGVLLTLVAVGIDPFTQQIVRYHPCPSLEGMHATIARMNNYTFPIPVVQSLIGARPVDVPTEGAFYSGLFGAPLEPPFSCPTAKCTFKDGYYSIGVCSMCEDITSTLSITNGTRLPSGLILEAYLAAQSILHASLPHGSYSLAMQLITSSVGIVGQTTPSWSKESPQLGAAQCMLYPCVKEYTASVSKGVLDEQLLSSTPLNMTTDTSYPTVRIDCLSKQERVDLASAGFDLTGNPAWLYLKSDKVPRINASCLYEFGAKEWVSFGTAFGASRNIFASELPFFDGNVTVDGYSGLTGSPQLQAIYNQGNITFETVKSTFESIATSVTAMMRRRNGADVGALQPAKGKVVGAETCVAVRWAWLTLPLCLLILTLVFFATTLYRSRRRERNAWKSSSLALLFHGLDSRTRAKHGELATTAEMDDAAKVLLVQLQRTERGWRFADAETPSNAVHRRRTT